MTQHDLEQLDIPHVYLDFPEFVVNPKYTFEKLRPYVEHIPFDHFATIFRKLEA